METMPLLRQLFAYDEWANREALASLRRTSGGAPPPPGALRLMAHVVGAEWLWLARVLGERQPMDVWPVLDVDECASKGAEVAERWRALLDTLDGASLERAVSYVNSKGEAYTSTVRDILLHVVMHSGYHRGQVATIVREAGREPAYTDYIHAVRRGLLE